MCIIRRLCKSAKKQNCITNIFCAKYGIFIDICKLFAVVVCIYPCKSTRNRRRRAVARLLLRQITPCNTTCVPVPSARGIFRFVTFAHAAGVAIYVAAQSPQPIKTRSLVVYKKLSLYEIHILLQHLVFSFGYHATKIIAIMVYMRFFQGFIVTHPIIVASFQHHHTITFAK